jgi:hypothetical protein
MTKYFTSILFFIGSLAFAQMPSASQGSDGKITGTLIDSVAKTAEDLIFVQNH